MKNIIAISIKDDKVTPELITFDEAAAELALAEAKNFIVSSIKAAGVQLYIVKTPVMRIIYINIKSK